MCKIEWNKRYTVNRNISCCRQLTDTDVEECELLYHIPTISISHADKLTDEIEMDEEDGNITVPSIFIQT
jgi:hypothetical protein